MSRMLEVRRRKEELKRKNLFLKLLLASYFCLLTSFASASSCNFASLNFGMSQAELKKEYKLDTLDVATEGEALITVPAREICENLPDTAMIKFIMMDDKFVKVTILNQYMKGQLLIYAISIFGERDDKDVHKMTSEHKIKMGIWGKNDNYSAAYRTYTKGKREMERMDITSKKHQELFDKINTAKGKAQDEYMREKRLGIYSGDYKNIIPEDIQEQLKIRHKVEDHKRVLKENEDSRGFHYE